MWYIAKLELLVKEITSSLVLHLVHIAKVGHIFCKGQRSHALHFWVAIFTKNSKTTIKILSVTYIQPSVTMSWVNRNILGITGWWDCLYKMLMRCWWDCKCGGLEMLVSMVDEIPGMKGWWHY